ncbi:rhomboid family intramembrane serine protease [Nesterenkonia sp.]|uniref:rhomboid family intramembrane serine protease n=1 Tax=Nesterenkonia sp. TaxID=704201 RepID=UPI00262EF0FF|nr:rhomboid family intramembrane serine protease [Nesterenkonia sp.]
MSASGDSFRAIGSDFTAMVKRTFIPVLLPLAAMWVLFFVSLALGNWFNRSLALEARSLSGLVGIVFMPLLHGSFAHLLANTMSWLVLGGMTSLLTRRFTSVMVMLWLLSGAVLWLIGSPWVCHAPQGASCVVNHVGASTVVYGFAAFIVTYAILARRFLAMLFGVFVAFVYGLSMLIGMLPITPGVSWTGHLSGAIAGVAVAFMLTKEARAQRVTGGPTSAQLSRPQQRMGRSRRRGKDDDGDGMEIDYSKYLD